MPDEMDHIADLERRLYTRDPDNLPKRKFGILHPVRQKTNSTWGQTTLPVDKGPRRKSAVGYKHFFIFSITFFAIALAVALFSLYRGAVTVSNKNVDVVVLGNAFIAGGEELPIQVEVVNHNSTDLTNVKLTLNYPRGATDETGTDTMRIERVLGTIGSGKTKSEEFIAILYGEQGTSRDVTAVLTYQINNSTAVFEKQSKFSVMISSSPVGLTVDAPTAVVSNQPFTLTVRNAFSGDKLLTNVITRVEYPNGFVFQSATPKPTAGNNVWNIGDLTKGDERTIVITGKIIGEDHDEKAFRTYVGTPENDTSSKIAVAYNSVLSTMVITQPFIAASMNVNGKADDIVALTIGDDIDGVISWGNNSTNPIANATFTLVLDGTSIDLTSIDAPNSYFDKLQKTITWTPESNSRLAYLAPGDRGELPFKFKTTGATDVGLKLSLVGSFPDQNNIIQTIESIDQKIVRFASHIQFAGQALYSTGAFQNSGPYPPKADMETTYTLSWTILPTENALTGVTASAVLPAGVRWVGAISPQTETVTYNQETRTVTWNVGPLPKATSVLKNRTVSFQVAAKPTASQVGNPLELLGATTIGATDTVTQTELSVTRPALTTKLDADPAYIPGKERVLP